MDRGYNDYELFANWTRTGVYFVTRLKDNADYIVIEQHPVAARSTYRLLMRRSFLPPPKAQKNMPVSVAAHRGARIPTAGSRLRC